MIYPLTYDTWNNSELKAINRVVKSKKFTMGIEVKNFEKNFSKFIKSKYSVMVNSGSSANLLALSSLFFSRKYNIKKGDEIIAPSISWSTTFAPIQQLGLRLKLVDIDPLTLNLDIKLLEKAISKKTKIIFVVNLLGNPNEFNKIKRIIKNKNIIIVEDNCEGLGAKFGNRYCGTIGKLGTFSFFYSHHISTMEGGMITTDDEELYNYLLALRAHGWTREIPNKNKINLKKSNYNFEEHYNFILPGYNLRPGEINAAIGTEQLKKFPKFLKIRKKNAEIYKSLFSNHPVVDIQTSISESSWFGFAFILKKEVKINRINLIKKLQKKNIECRPIVSGSITNQKMIKYFDKPIYNNLKNSALVNTNGFMLGNSHINLKKQLEYVNYIISNIDENF
jgi:CDP-4-dehydro-6-deoxyglucose reductase, E1